MPRPRFRGTVARAGKRRTPPNRWALKSTAARIFADGRGHLTEVPPMSHVPGSLDELLSLFEGCFTQPTFQTFRVLVCGQISQIGLHTVTGMLVGARLSAVWHHCRAHRFFSRRRWSADELGLRLAKLIAERL